MVAVGDVVEAVVLDIDPSQNRISLGMKQIEPNPYESLVQKYPPGTVVRGKVRNIADFGIFVEIEEGIDGLVHISDMSWTQRVEAPVGALPEGRRGRGGGAQHRHHRGRQAEALARHQAAHRRSVGPHPVRLSRSARCVTAKVQKVLDFGAFVELEKGIEGLIHVSEISDERVEDPRSVLKPGQEVKAEIISIDQAERKIGLSMKAANRSAELAEAQGYSGSAPGATLGDVFRNKLKGLQKTDNE